MRFFFCKDEMKQDLRSHLWPESASWEEQDSEFVPGQVTNEENTGHRWRVIL